MSGEEPIDLLQPVKIEKYHKSYIREPRAWGKSIRAWSKSINSKMEIRRTFDGNLSDI